MLMGALMFVVLFEVQPRSEKWDEYLGIARMLRPELEAVDGFVENVRYHSLRRKGWLLSLSTWRDEKALIRWRTRAAHHDAQERGRFEVFGDYHLRVGQLIDPASSQPQQRLDVTEAGAGTCVTVTDAKRPAEWVKASSPETVAAVLGWEDGASGLVAWDVLDAVLTPGDLVLLMTWRDEAAADRFALKQNEDARLRRVRVLRDYGMFDRREAPQYYPEVTRD
jgi:heme-degrading monooxygenase HmoA